MKTICTWAAALMLGAVIGCEHNGPSQTPDPMGNPDPNLRHQPANPASPDAASGGPAAPAPDPLNNMGTSQQNAGSSSQSGSH